MIWGYPYFWKHPYGFSTSVSFLSAVQQFVAFFILFSLPPSIDCYVDLPTAPKSFRRTAAPSLRWVRGAWPNGPMLRGFQQNEAPLEISNQPQFWGFFFGVKSGLKLNTLDNTTHLSIYPCLLKKKSAMTLTKRCMGRWRSSGNSWTTGGFHMTWANRNRLNDSAFVFVVSRAASLLNFRFAFQATLKSNNLALKQLPKNKVTECRHL